MHFAVTKILFAKSMTHDICMVVYSCDQITELHRINITPLKTNMSPENQWLEDVFPTEIVPF